MTDIDNAAESNARSFLAVKKSQHLAKDALHAMAERHELSRREAASRARRMAEQREARREPR